MEFAVNPMALEQYATQVNRAAEDVRDARSYFQKYAPVESEGGEAWHLAADAHRRAVDSIATIMDRAALLLDTSNKELLGAGAYYRTADAAAQQRMDANLPSLCIGYVDPLARAWAGSGCTPGFADIRIPTRHLTPVDDVKYSHPLGFMDAMSVSHWALEAFNIVFGFNPLSRIQEFAFGDWEPLAKAGISIGRVGEASYDVGYNLQGGAVAMSQYWQGNAADAAYAYFNQLANGIANIKDRMAEIARQYDQIAHAVWSASEALGGVVKGLVDAAIIAGISFAAGTITAETGVGAVVGYGVAALEVANMLRLWAGATSVMQNCYSVVQLAAGAIVGGAADLDLKALALLPGAGAYDHPIVKV